MLEIQVERSQNSCRRRRDKGDKDSNMEEENKNAEEENIDIEEIHRDDSADSAAIE